MEVWSPNFQTVVVPLHTFTGLRSWVTQIILIQKDEQITHSARSDTIDVYHTTTLNDNSS